MWKTKLYSYNLLLISEDPVGNHIFQRQDPKSCYMAAQISRVPCDQHLGSRDVHPS